MLVLNRTAQVGKDCILLNRGKVDEVLIRVLKIKGGHVTIGIQAPGEVNVVRQELVQ